MYTQLKISEHEHSGRLRPHEHTSYIPLFIMILVVGLLLLGFSLSSYVSAGPRDPQAGSIGITGTMPAKPPTVAATITTPQNQQHFSFSPVKVAGTCPTSTLVEIFKNNIFGGSVQCDDAGNYSLDVDLLYGQNILIAQVYDTLNQAGPQSNPVTIYYDASLPSISSLSFLNFGGGQLLLSSDAVYRGTFPGDTLNVPLTIIGGVGPYAVNVQWGDSSNKVVPRSDNSVFNMQHVYKKAGNYKVTFQVTDSQQQTAFLTVAVVVNGQPAIYGNIGVSDSSPTSKLNKLLVLWPLFAIIATMVISFWVGERHEKHVLGKTIQELQNPTLGVPTHTSV